MPKFKFDLQKVLNVRSIREDIARNEFFQARKEKEVIEKQLQQLNFVQNDICNFIKNEKLDLYQMIQARDYLHNNRLKIKQTKQQLHKKKKDVFEKKEQLIERRKNRQVLDNLKDKKEKEHYREMIAREQKEIDEVAVNYYAGGLS